MLLLVVFWNYLFFSCDLLGISKYFYVNMQGIFFNATFLQFWAFLQVYITILGGDHMEICFYFKYTYFREHYSVLKKSDLDTMSYYLWKNASIEKNLNFDQLYIGAWQITWKSEPNLLMTMEVFQNINFLSCDLLGICVYLDANM